MIIGIGQDIIEIERIKKAVSSERFLVRYFTVKEIELYRRRNSNPEVLAGNFAVKEAVAKVFGTGFIGFTMIDIEVLRDDYGKPYVNLYRQAKEKAYELGIMHLHVSISHNKTNAVGLAIGEK
jgi:holo-[acyl-carrier protein] synthase